MALPKGRKIVVEGRTYRWLIKDPRPTRQRHLTWTPRAFILTLQAEGGVVQQFICQSTKWTPQDEYDMLESGSATKHKVTFGPRQVRDVIEGRRTGRTLFYWEVTPKARNRSRGQNEH